MSLRLAPTFSLSLPSVACKYYSDLQRGNTNFEVIHKVFGSKNAFNLLIHLPIKDRNEAVATMIYKAQARIQDSTYGCVSEILMLQQQVINLQIYQAFLKEFVDSYANLQHVQNQIPLETNPIPELYPSIAGDINELEPADFQTRQHEALSQASTFGQSEDNDAVQPSQPAIDERSIWLEVAGGKKKGCVYGMGSEVYVIPGSYYLPSPPPPSLSSLAEQIQEVVRTAIEPFHDRLSALEGRLPPLPPSSSSLPPNPSDH
ncbi:LOB domain-containing protein 30-like [Diospyros lotus]|uniref:LOB domain-containing protein 30-like n=1 Tax=Diospyros lotus TaxID=55363 RepID=UPI002257F104|nr:LOB domain-containing protein 30-like [Diospyros lotus]